MSEEHQEASNKATPGSPDLANLATTIAAVAAVLTSSAYAVIRPAYEYFYYQLGLRPDDVGIDEASMVARAAALAAFIAAFTAAIGLISVGLGRFTASRFIHHFSGDPAQLRSWAGKHKIRTGGLVLSVLAISVGFVYIAVVTTDEDGELSYRGLMSLAAFTSVVFAAFFVVLGYRWPPGEPLHLWRRHLRGNLLVLLGLVSLLAACSAGYIWDSASKQGYALLKNDGTSYEPRLNDWFSFMQGQLSVRLVTPGKDPQKVCISGANAIGLGRKDGLTWVVLLRPNGASKVVGLDPDSYITWYDGGHAEVCGVPTR